MNEKLDTDLAELKARIAAKTAQLKEELKALDVLADDLSKTKDAAWDKAVLAYTAQSGLIAALEAEKKALSRQARIARAKVIERDLAANHAEVEKANKEEQDLRAKNLELHGRLATASSPRNSHYNAAEVEKLREEVHKAHAAWEAACNRIQALHVDATAIVSKDKWLLS